MRNAFVCCWFVALMSSIGTANAQDWTKSKWGPDDEIGAANYMKPELVVKAASLVKTGKTYALGIPVDSKTPAYPPRSYKITIVQPGQAGINGLGPSKTTYNDDIIDTWVGIGSQLDGLGKINRQSTPLDFSVKNSLHRRGSSIVGENADCEVSNLRFGQVQSGFDDRMAERHRSGR